MQVINFKSGFKLTITFLVYLCLFSSGCKLDQKQLNKKLIVAVKSGNISETKRLLDAGADQNMLAPLDFINGEPAPVITHAMFTGYPKLVKLFIKPGTNLNIIDGGGWSILKHAVNMGYCGEILELLLESGADPNYHKDKNKIYFIPLNTACAKKLYKCSELLIKYGAKINTRTYDNVSPLYVAVHTRDIEIIKLLLKNGADVNMFLNKEETILDWAKVNSTKEIIDLLEKWSKAN